ncbi:MAG: iron-containing alcohol dehydrogenase [Firmicutes bacterium]|nr:iron-containing alcohol dehydrogenase [Bacillota bacterium]MBQ9972114.1 iron-containing alcohol dehydrogenase [Bacillota bacterium]
MKDFIYCKPTKIIFGKNAVEEVAGILAEQGKKKALLIFGGNSLKSTGTYDRIAGPLKAAGIEVVDCGGITAPEYKFLEPAMKLAKEEAVDVVIGIGGSTCMDFSKMVALAVKHDDIMDYLTYEKMAKDGDAETIVTIPTYPSGGSETDEAAEVDYLPNGRHGGLYGMHADYAVLNPEFSYSLSPKLSAYGAMVVLHQTSVPYLGSGDSPITDGYNRVLIENLLKSLEIVVKDPENYNARANLMFASTQGTSGYQHCGKDLSWPFQIYDEVGIIRKLMGMKYREVFAAFMPHFVLAHSKYHVEDAKRYMIDIMGADSNLPTDEEIIKDGYDKWIALLEKFDVPAYYDAYGEMPSDEALSAAIDAEGMEPGDLSKEEQIAMFKSCFKA